MAKWLFDSKGKPIAFVADDKAFSTKGHFIGRLEENQEIWHGRYRGEIVEGDRLLYDRRKRRGARSRSAVPRPPAKPARPANKRPIRVPTGYRDVEL